MAHIRRYYRKLTSIGQYCLVPVLCAAAIVRPSVIGFIYFILFLFAGTWWGAYKRIGRCYGIFLLCCVPILLGHMSLLYAYQTQSMQEILPPNAMIARLLGVRAFIRIRFERGSFKYFIYASDHWYSYVNPGVLYLTYCLLVLVGKHLIDTSINEPIDHEIESHLSVVESGQQILALIPSKSVNKMDTKDLAEYSKIMKKKKKKKKKSQKRQRKTKFSSMIYVKSIIDDAVDESSYDEGEMDFWKRISRVFEVIMVLTVRFAYIGTIIVMMFWSVTVVSWLSIIFLIWAIVLWMMPNKKESVLHSSVFLVAYSTFLLLNNYLYTLKLTDQELPSRFGSISLCEINDKDNRMRQLFLFIRSVYILMFWITMRQSRQQRVEQLLPADASRDFDAESKILPVSDISPVPITSNTEEFIMDFLTKFWIWLIGVFLFLAAVVEQRMSAIRIGYMTLFLFLILSFQISFTLWRRILKPFLWCLVAYATLILLAVYTYQFKHFDHYWEKYLGVSKNAQQDIGLEIFKHRSQYLHRIVTPTVLIILTNIQVHYINEAFLKMCDPKVFSPVDDTMCYIHMGFKQAVIYYKEQVFRFLEIHMMKLVLFFAILMCTFDVCATYFVIVALISISFILGKYLQIFTIFFSSLLISVYILAKMIYQIQFVTQEPWIMNCELKQRIPETQRNVARWLGFKKLEKADLILATVDWNIGFVVVVTMWIVVLTRQRILRKQRGVEDEKVMLMFPGISARNADRSLMKFTKYIFNYGFYRIGVEICLIWTAIVVALRMDAYSILYALWLCIMFPMTRDCLRRIWPLYLIFIAMIVPFQYLMATGFPPWMCSEYPWDRSGTTFMNLRKWAFLPSVNTQSDGRKILPDFVLLMLVSFQWSAFLIEWNYIGKIYEGGSNDSVSHLYEEPNFVNPKNDFYIHTKSYLDIVKRVILPGSFWLSLAAVFLTSIYQVNIYYLGYLLLAFIFLWHGISSYLMPITKVLRRWECLIAYTTIVILIKTTLQIFGCFYIEKLPRKSCWLTEILAIGCWQHYKHHVEVGDGHDHCKLSEYSGVGLDVACFALLLIQRRIFRSYDFFHIMNDVKADMVLGSRGTDILDDLVRQRSEVHQRKEDLIKGKIDLKMSKIVANHQKIQGSFYNKITSHEIAIRSGDYYMFDEVQNEDVDILPEIEEDREEKDSSLGLGDLLTHYIKKNLDTAIKRRQTLFSVEGTSSALLLDESVSVHRRSKLLKIFKIITRLIDSSIISIVNMLNNHSKDYRKVQRILIEEKQALKDRTNYHVGVRLGPGKWWQPTGTFKTLLMKSQRQLPTVTDQSDNDEMSTTERPTILKLLIAFSYAAFSESKNICYTVIFLNQIHRSSFLYLPLALMVFFWATLTIPRPSKTFWVLVINYTAISVILKGMFQFSFLNGNSKTSQHIFRTSLQEDNPFDAHQIMGLQWQNNYALWDLIVLMAVFMHRANLKMLGMWKENITVAALLEDGDYEVVGEDLRKQPERGKSKPDNLIQITTKKAAVLNHLKGAIELSLVRYAQGWRIFFQQLLNPTSHEPTDVYTWIFWCEFFNLFVVIFGYSSFIKSDVDDAEGVASYIKSSQIPVHFLVFLMILFINMIIDRALYLRKDILGKIIFQLVQVLVLHIWLILLFPMITGKQCYMSTTPKVFYIFKCFYFLLSAYQIRSGYPSRILGYFCCKNFGIINFVIFKIYMLIPFLFEIRTCLDWMLTETSMSLFDWIKMEDIFRNVFIVKCERYRDNEFSSPRGRPKKVLSKIIMGAGSLLALSAIIWFPVILFAMTSTVGVPNIPRSAELVIRIGRYEPIYYMGDRENIFTFKPHEFNRVKSLYNPYKISKDFIYKYDAEDVAAIAFHDDSTHIWSITALNRKTMIAEVESNHPLPISLVYRMKYRGHGETEKGVEQTMTTYLPPHTENRNNLLKMLKGEDAQPVEISYILPKFLAMSSSGSFIAVPSLMLEYPVPAAKAYRNITLTIQRGENTEWWKIKEQCGDFNFENFLQSFPYADCENFVTMYTFNGRTFTNLLEKVTAGGILALYGIYFFTICKILRLLTQRIYNMWFDEMPNADRIYQLVVEIYTCREWKYFQLEEQLFAQLIFVMRSRDLCISLTRLADSPYRPRFIQN